MNKELMNIQTALKAPKNQFNKFGGYKYRSCEDILEAVKPLLKEQGAMLTISDEIVQIGDRFYVKAEAHFCSESGEVTASAYAREADQKKGMDAAQVTGSASSYARKYALNGLFCIDDSKDADYLNNGQNTQKKAQKKQTMSAGTCKKMYIGLRNKGFDEATVKQVMKKEFGVDDAKQLTVEQGRKLYKLMEAQNE